MRHRRQWDSQRRRRETYATDRLPISTIVGQKTRMTIYSMMQHADAESARRVIVSYIVQENTAYTDDYRCYRKLYGYDYRSINPHFKRVYARGNSQINGCESRNLCFDIFMLPPTALPRIVPISTPHLPPSEPTYTF